MDHYKHHPLSLVIGQKVPLHFGFLLSELQGSLPKLLVKKPMEGPTVLGRVLYIVMNPS